MYIYICVCGLMDGRAPEKGREGRRMCLCLCVCPCMTRLTGLDDTAFPVSSLLSSL